MYLDFGKTRHATGITAWLTDIAGRFAQMINTAAKALEGHRAVRRMAELDDRILEDIGLSRADIDRARFSPLMTDPRQDLAFARHNRISAKHRRIKRRR
jgi:uncharacterized protein YjiS (DUF1127 family)